MSLVGSSCQHNDLFAPLWIEYDPGFKLATEDMVLGGNEHGGGEESKEVWRVG